MTAEAQRAQALSSAAAVLSAFLVFVLGGGVLLGVWAQQRDVAESAAEEAAIAAEADRLAEQARKEKEAASAATVKRKTPRRTTRARTKAPAETKDPVAAPVKESVKSAKSAKAATTQKSLTGRGSVLVYGNATRVRLVGAKGTFGAGKVPSGRYTVQATFVGFEPRMAGTVEVSDGARISLVCSSSTKTCEAR